MNFLFLRDFFRIFLIYFTIFNVNKNLKKMQKGFIFSRGTHVDAAWHSGPRGSATWALNLYLLVLLMYNI